MIPTPRRHANQPAPCPGDGMPTGRRRPVADTTATRPGGFPIVAATVSVLAHACVIAVLMNTSLRSHAPALEDKTIVMRLLPTPDPEQQPPVAEQAPLPTEDRTEAPAAPPSEPASKPTSRTIVSGPVEAPPTPDVPLADEPLPDPDPARAGTLRATVLEQVQRLPTEANGESRPALPWTSSGEPVPGVPGARGWLSAYVGTVTPGADTWRDNDGASRGRYVLANGTVVCTRRRAPTIDEMMNPWKSVAVTMASICGRERPDAPDFSDPRVKPPPLAARPLPQDGG